MVNQSEITQIVEAHNKVKPEDVLSSLSYETSCFYDPANLELRPDGYIEYHFNKSSILAESINVLKHTDNVDGMLITSKPTGYIYRHPKTKSPLLDNSKHTKSKWTLFLYDNNDEAINLIGKKYTKHRVAMRYLDDPDIKVQHFNLADNPLTSEALMAIKGLNQVWRIRQAELGNKVAYDIDRSITSIYQNGHLSEYYVTLVWYKDTLLHFYTSNRMNQHYVAILDCKSNHSVSKEIERKFQYMYFMQHTLHLRYWDLELDEEGGDRSYPIYYDIGLSIKESYKNHLRPVIADVMLMYKVSDLDFIEKPKVVESTNLF